LLNSAHPSSAGESVKIIIDRLWQYHLLRDMKIRMDGQAGMPALRGGAQDSRRTSVDRKTI